MKFVRLTDGLRGPWLSEPILLIWLPPYFQTGKDSQDGETLGEKNRETNAREKVLPLSTTKSGENVLSHLSLTEFKRQGHSD